ncbi:MAG: imidazolonepropionase [Candidatus Cloacimonetes bacterium]|nr:imidazolonepropionase [Candidatus Cloacimonadota bacterium]
MKIDLIIKNAKELLTLSSKANIQNNVDMNNLEIRNNTNVFIDNGLIIKISNENKYLDFYQSENVIDASNKVVMPGFVDAHTHPVYVDSRENEFEMRIKGKSYVEISQSGGGIRSSIKAVRDASEDELYDLAYKRILRIISQGTTTLEAKSGYGLSIDSEIKMLNVIKRLNSNLPIDIKSTFLGAHEFPEEYKNDKEKYINILINEMLPEVKRQNIAEYCDIFCEKHVFNIEQSRRILNRAKELGFKIRMHADEIEPIGGAELAAEIGAISADHLGATSDEGINAMKKTGVIPILLPGTIFSLGMKKYAPARKMIDNGLPIALATDFNPGSCNCDSMQFIITLATLQMKMTVAESITASTINAARSLNLADKVGSIEEGKHADILIMNMPSYKYLPYHFGSNNVETVIKNGKVIYEEKNI